MPVTIDEIAERLGPIVKALGAERAIVFGSLARGTQDQHSDLDLLIIDDEDLPYLRRLDKYFTAISSVFPMPVELFIYRRQELEGMREGAFLAKALAEGITVYES
ncbi:MAG: nucleotidyltransferase domain-containing protein [Thermodesulfobacteriota bacterium]